LHRKLPAENFLVSETIYPIESSFSGRSTSEAHPWRGPARANRAAEYARKGSESVDPTRSSRGKIIQQVFISLEFNQAYE